MAQNKVRIGFVGVGNMGQCAHIKHYAVLPDCEVVALAEIRPQMAQKVAQRYGVPNVYADHKELLAKEKLDGIVAVHPFSRHGVLVPELLEAGVPVLTEKPLAHSVEAGEKIVRAVEKSGTWMMIGYNKRSDPANMFAREEITRLKNSGKLGPLKYVRITMPPGDWIKGGFDDLIKSDEALPPLQSDPPPSDMDDTTFKLYKSFVNYYIHQVNLMRCLLGEPYEAAYVDKSNVLLAGQSKSGAACLIEMNTYRTTIDWQEAALVCFEKGWLKIDIPAPLAANRAGRVTIFKDPGDGAKPETTIPSLPSVSSMRQQAVNFIRAIRGEAPPPCDAKEALEDLKVARQYIRLLKGC